MFVQEIRAPKGTKIISSSLKRESKLHSLIRKKAKQKRIFILAQVSDRITHLVSREKDDFSLVEKWSSRLSVLLRSVSVNVDEKGEEFFISQRPQTC